MEKIINYVCLFAIGIFLFWFLNDFIFFIIFLGLCLVVIFISHTTKVLSFLMKKKSKEESITNLFDKNYLNSEITEETKKTTIKAARSGHFSHTPTRIALGKFFTNKDYKKWKEKISREFNKK